MGSDTKRTEMIRSRKQKIHKNNRKTDMKRFKKNLEILKKMG